MKKTSGREVATFFLGEPSPFNDCKSVLRQPVVYQEPTPSLPSVANGGFAPLCGAAAISMAALKSSVANEGFAPLCGAAAISMAALKTPVAPVAPGEGVSDCTNRPICAEG